jgi:hypothetical protein
LLPFMNSNKTVPFISKAFTKGPSVTWFVIRAMKLSISPVWLRWNFCPQEVQTKWSCQCTSEQKRSSLREVQVVLPDSSRSVQWGYRLNHIVSVLLGVQYPKPLISTAILLSF